MAKCYRCKYSIPCLVDGDFRCPYKKYKVVTPKQEESCKRFDEAQIFKTGGSNG